MDKSSVIGFVLMGLVFVGFTIYQSNQAEKQLELRQAQEEVIKARQDSIAALIDVNVFPVAALSPI